MDGTLWDGVECYAQGFNDFLKTQNVRYKLFIVSNCAEFTIKYFMEWAEIEKYITDSMAHAVNFKPKNENIKYWVDRYDLKNPVYVGDTQSDGKQSELANISFVSYGFGKTDKYDLKFDTFNELTEYFEKK